jgi:porphobilinogen synthase
MPFEANGAALAEAIPDVAGRHVAVVRASTADPDVPAVLRSRGAEVAEITAYETVEGPPESEAALRQALRNQEVAAVLFASGSAVRGFVKLGGSRDLPAITIGPRTSAAAREAGFTVAAEARAQGVAEMVEAVERTIPKTSGALARPRRLRTSPAMRDLLRETRLDPARLIAPLFVISGAGRRYEIESLKGHARISPDLALREAHRLAGLGVGGVLLFGIPDAKDDRGSGADDPAGPVSETLRLLKRERLPLALAADVCLCEYTSHGHCGILDGEAIDNDASLSRLASAALAYAAAGADVVGPSAMMDHQVGALRAGLDAAGFAGTTIMSYSSKHASSLYGPFREAAGSAPSFGDRKSYQMDFANGREALREMQLDADEGADILMVKPAITSLDLLAVARGRFDLPMAAYQVSGEAAMIEAAAERGWLDRRDAILETLTAIERAGAGITITYFAADVAQWLRKAK